MVILFLFVFTGLGVFLLQHFAIQTKEKENLTTVKNQVKVDNLKTSQGPFEIPVYGIIKPLEEAFLSSEINGIIQKKSPSSFTGMAVKKGEILFEIYHKDLVLQKEKIQKMINKLLLEIKELNIQAEISEKELMNQKEILALSEKENNRMQDLSKGDHIPLNQFEQAKIQYLQTKIRSENLEVVIKSIPIKKETKEESINELKIQISEIEEKINKAEIKAPFDGIVKEVYAEIGSIASPGLRLIAVYNSKILEISLNISKKEKQVLDSFDDASQIKLILEMDDSVIGEFHRYEGKLSTTTKMQTAVFRFSENKKLIPGEMVKAIIQVPTKEKYFKIKKSVVNNQMISTVVDGKLKRVKISPKFELKDDYILFEGVKEGDQIIENHLPYIVDDSPVTIYQNLENFK